MKTVLVTGSNRGIGLALVRQLKERGFRVTAVCRRASEALKSLDVEMIEGVDVSQETGIEVLKKALGDNRQFDVAINNAGILAREDLDSLDFESMERQFQVNALAPLRVVNVVLPMLSKGSKIIMMTSRMGSIADNTSGSYYGYRMSKAALNMASVSLAHDVKEKGIAVGIIHPGYVQTEMTNNTGDITAEESAAGILARIEDLTLETSGTFWHSNGEKLLW